MHLQRSYPSSFAVDDSAMERSFSAVMMAFSIDSFSLPAGISSLLSFTIPSKDFAALRISDISSIILNYP